MPNPRKPFAASRRIVAVICATSILAYASVRPASAVITLINETFSSGTTSTAFTTGTAVASSTGTSKAACLTAGTGGASTLPACTTTLNPNNGGNSGSLPDAAGAGTLRLTDNTTNQSSFVILQNAVPTGTGIQASFDIFSYGGTGADGIGFLVLDGTQAAPTQSGASGGSFGYAPKSGTGCCDAPGIAGGYFGIAIDEYGNFSNPTEGRTGGPGLSPQSVAIRGSAATNYAYITGATTTSAFSTPASVTRPSAVNVRVSVSPLGYVKVDMDFSGTSKNFVSVIPSFNIASFSGQGAVPTSLRFGFSGSTGGKTNFHEIRNFVTNTLAPNLAITKAHVGTSFAENGAGQYTIGVSNDPSGGPATNTITVTDTLPAGETFASASGTNWVCTAGSTTQFTCVYQAAQLNPGTSAPPITVNVNVAPNAGTPLVNSATVNTSDNAVAGGATATDSVTVTAAAALRLYKRILQITTKGPTPGPATTPRVVTYTPDPTNLTGVLGTATALPVYPGDTIEYGIYYINAGTDPALRSTTQTTLGPVFSDPIDNNLNYVANSQTSTCCVNPTATDTAVFASTGTSGTNQVLTWSLPAPLQPATTQTTVQGGITFSATVR